MEEKKIAVRCETREKYDQVIKRSGKCFGKDSDYWANYRAETCLCIDDTSLMYDRVSYFHDHPDYTIISAEEYLKEGIKGFKVGDRVEIIETVGNLTIGMLGTIELERPPKGSWDVELDDRGLDGRKSQGVHQCYFKLANKTIKQEDKDMNGSGTNANGSILINSTVAKVFKDIDKAQLVTKYLGSEYVEGSHKDYLALKANDKAVLEEAVRLDKEDKANKTI